MSAENPSSRADSFPGLLFAHAGCMPFNGVRFHRRAREVVVPAGLLVILLGAFAWSAEAWREVTGLKHPAAVFEALAGIPFAFIVVNALTREAARDFRPAWEALALTPLEGHEVLVILFLRPLASGVLMAVALGAGHLIFTGRPDAPPGSADSANTLILAPLCLYLVLLPCIEAPMTALAIPRWVRSLTVCFFVGTPGVLIMSALVDSALGGGQNIAAMILGFAFCPATAILTALSWVIAARNLGDRMRGDPA